MPIFEYKGINQAGKNKSGVIDAENLKAARARLKKDGIFVTDLKNKIKAQSKKQSSSLFQKNVPIKDLALMTRQLAVLIKSQIPLVDALAAVPARFEAAPVERAIECLLLLLRWRRRGLHASIRIPV